MAHDPGAALVRVNSCSRWLCQFGIGLCLLVASIEVSYSQDLETEVIESLDPTTLVEELKNESLKNNEPRDLTVLAPTIASEEIDRAVLNRLMSEIANDPDTTRNRLGVSDAELQDVYITVSNARNFINNNEMANIRAMCSTWNESTQGGEARIEEALDAYKARRQFTRDFIARYYRVIVADIEATLSEPSKVRFRAYMDDRRRRMANAGGVTWGAVVENVASGRESIEFNCRGAR